jgi:hypothetical protein
MLKLMVVLDQLDAFWPWEGVSSKVLAFVQMSCSPTASVETTMPEAKSANRNTAFVLQHLAV